MQKKLSFKELLMKYIRANENVQSFLNNKLVVKRGFETLDISRGIDWNYQHKHNTATYQTYLHSLGIVNDLMTVSRKDENIELEKYAKDIILDWHKKNSLDSKNYAWKEHPVSSRINNIISFQSSSVKYKLSNRDFKNILISHCEYLNDERYYKFNNHGLMMDNALLNASKFIKDEDKKTLYINKALYRVRYAIRRDFSRKGVHLENSPEYHRMVLTIYKSVERKLKELKVKLGDQESEILKLAHDYKKRIIQPNQLYPMIGDTGKISDPKIKKDFRNFYDSEAGIAIFNNINEEDNQKSTMLVFKSGYHNKTHKHFDDLSSYLYIDGQELLIDSGKYSYSTKDPIRQHLISPKAHNTIFISGKDYKLVNPVKEQFKMKLTKSIIRPRYKLVVGVNKLYKGVSLTRYNILTKENIYIIIDRVVSADEEVSYQNFNLNEEAVVKKIDDLTYEVDLDTEQFLIQTFERYNSKLHSNIERGYISRSFANYQENNRVVFNQTSKNATYITAIYNKNNNKKLNEIKLRRNNLIYSIDGEETIVEL